MATFNVELNSRAGADGLYSVFVRVTENRKSKKVKLSFQIPKEHFNKDARYGKWIRTLSLKHKVHNEEIERKIDELKQQYAVLLAADLPALQLIGSDSDPKSKVTLRGYFDQYLANLKADTAVTYYKQQESKLNRFASYFGERTPIASIGTSHVAEFKKHLQLKGLSGTSVNSILGKIRTVFTLALNEDVIEKDPFRANKPAKAIPKGKIKLTDEQIQKLVELQSPGDRGVGWREIAKDCYLFSFYNAGIRISDLMQLRFVNLVGDRLEYQMDKTGHKKSIKLNKAALLILNKYSRQDAKPNDYIFPILDNSESFAKFVGYDEKRKMPWEIREHLYHQVGSKSYLMNKALKAISKQMELDENLSFHTARHSFADKARRTMKKAAGKVSLMDIKNMMGHKKIDTTEKYMKSFDVDSLDEAMDSIFD